MCWFGVRRDYDVFPADAVRVKDLVVDANVMGTGRESSSKVAAPIEDRKTTGTRAQSRGIFDRL